MAWRRFEGLTETRRWLLLVFLIGWMHAGAYALFVPHWQAPDEPGHYEVACLLSQVKRPLTGDDLSLPLQRDILANLAQHEFWTQVRAPWPAPLPLAFADDPFLAHSGRQVGDEPPLYYLNSRAHLPHRSAHRSPCAADSSLRRAAFRPHRSGCGLGGQRRG